MREDTIELPARNLCLHALRAGSAGPRVLLLHGFPEAGFVWAPVMEALQGEARLLAPTQRGYAPSSCPADPAAYHPRALVADLVALIESEGAPLDLLVAHDWGGALAWGLAAARPDLMRRLLIVNATHPAPFLKALREDPVQQAASAYMNALCAPGAAQRLLADGAAGLWAFFEGWDGRPPTWLDAPQRQRYLVLWQASLDTMLAWYRASPLRPPQSPEDAVMRLRLDPAAVTVRVPTRVLWGEDDRALPPSLLEGLEAFVPDLHIEREPGAGHWIVHERPGRVAQAIRDALAA